MQRRDLLRNATLLAGGLSLPSLLKANWVKLKERTKSSQVWRNLFSWWFSVLKKNKNCHYLILSVLVIVYFLNVSIGK